MAVVGVLVIAGLAVGGILLFGGDDDPGPGAADAPTTTRQAASTTVARTVPPTTVRTTTSFVEYGTPDPSGVWQAIDADGSFQFLFVDRREGSQVFDVLYYDDGVSGCSSEGFQYPGMLDSIGIMQPDGDLSVDEAPFECVDGDLSPSGFGMDLHYDTATDILDDFFGTAWERGSFWVGIRPWTFFDLCEYGEKGALGCLAVPPTSGAYGYAADPDMADYGAEREHAYAQGAAIFAYGFYLPVEVSGTVRLSAVLSSEFDLYEGPADGFSDVEVGVNATPIGTTRVRPDDGQGEWYSWEFDSSVLQPGTNSLYFAVRPGAEYPNGLAVYGPSLVDGVEDGFIVIEFDV